MTPRKDPIYTVTLCTMDGDTGANPLWHTCVLLSRYDEATQQMEVIASWGFYGLPTTDKDKESIARKVKLKLALDTDMYDNFGWWRREEVRYLDMGRGLHGATFQVTEEKANEFLARCDKQEREQEECVTHFAKALKLRPRGCEILRVSTAPTLETLDQLPIKCRCAFVRCGEQLFYVNNSKKKKCCDEIKIEKSLLGTFDAELKPAEKSRILMKDEATLAGELTGRKPDKTFRITPYEKWSALIFQMEKQLAKQQGREPRVHPFEFFNFIDGPITCKTEALDKIDGIVTPEQHERVTGVFRSVSRTSGPMETVHLYSVGPFRKFTKPNGEVVYSRSFDDKAKGTRVFWTIPPQEIEMFDEETEQMFLKYDAEAVKAVVRPLQDIDWLLINSGLDKKYPELFAQLSQSVHARYTAFSKLEPKEILPEPDDFQKFFTLFTPTVVTSSERYEKMQIREAQSLLDCLYLAMSKHWPVTGNKVDPEALVSCLKPAAQQRLYKILGRKPEHEPEVMEKRLTA